MADWLWVAHLPLERISLVHSPVLYCDLDTPACAVCVRLLRSTLAEGATCSTFGQRRRGRLCQVLLFLAFT